MSVDARTSERLWSTIPAVLALLGVALGVALTGGLDYLRDSRSTTAELRQVKRLVALEVGENAVAFAVLDTDRMTAPDALRTSTWDKHRDVLARYVSHQDWEALYAFYGYVDDVRQMVTTSPLVRLTDDDLEGVHEARVLAEEVRRRLGEPPTSLLQTWGNERIAYNHDPERDNPSWAQLYNDIYPIDSGGADPDEP